MSSSTNIDDIFKNFNFDLIELPKPHSKIYKSECVLSFDTTKSKGGIFVCLKTFLCFNKEYVHDYFKKTKNCVFLNIKEIIKENPTKVKEVFDFGTEKVEIETDRIDEYEQLLSLVIYQPVKIVIPLPNKSLPTKIQNCIEIILKIDSEKKKQSIIPLKEKLNESIHSKDLKQINEGMKISKGGWKCAKCDKTDNLWLNLTDGFIGCGRKNFDGTGGNNHAVQHYNETSFPIAVKLGTITPHGADVFSYSEKNMVKDKNLDLHLKWFGIDMKQMKKTDKTMDELTLDAARKLEFSNVLEKGKDLKPVFGPELTGLNNIGNTCYMNSLLQCLFTVKEFSNRYLDLKFEKYFKNGNNILNPSDNFEFQMTKLTNGITSGIYSVPSEERRKALELKRKEVEKKGTDEDVKMKDKGETEIVGQDGIKPHSFKFLVGKNHPEFSTFNQQDPHEFCQHLFKLIERDEKFKNNSFDVTKVFKFMVEERLECSITNCVRYKESEEVILSLKAPIVLSSNLKEYSEYEKVRNEEERLEEIERQKRLLKEAERKKLKAEGKDVMDTKGDDDVVIVKKKEKAPVVRPIISMENCLKAYGSISEIDNWYSTAANTHTVAKQTARIRTFPDYLIVKIDKYYFSDAWVPKKLDVFVENPQEIDINFLRGKGLQSGEKELPKTKPKPKYNMNCVNQLMTMGFGMNRCKRAAVATNNNAEQALNWIFSHENDPDIDLPLEEESETTTLEPSDTLINNLTLMGIGRNEAIFSLKKTNNNAQRAVDYYFNHSNEIASMLMKGEGGKKEEEGDNSYLDGSGKYELFGFISHIGSSTLSGHYVCHVKKNGKWILFNDESVMESQDTPFNRGYMFFYKRK